MPHPLVLQLRFTRSEFRRGLAGLSEAEARQRLMPMNCISRDVGHMVWQEQRYFLFYGQGQFLLPEVNKLFAYRAPASTPAGTPTSTPMMIEMVASSNVAGNTLRRSVSTGCEVSTDTPKSPLSRRFK